MFHSANPRRPVCLTFAQLSGRTGPEDRLLATTANGNCSPRRQVEGLTAVTQVTPEGQVVDDPFAEGLKMLSELAFVPDGFEAHAAD